MTFKRLAPYLLILPIILLYGLFIGGGLLGIIIESLGHIPVLGLYGFDITSYITVVSHRGFISSLLYSVYISLVASLIATILGILIGYSFITSSNKLIKAFVKRCLQFGLITPYLYAVFIGMLLLNQSGFLARIMYNIGMITTPEAFPQMIFDSRAIGIIFVFVFKGTPFIALFTISIMSRISNTYNDVARTLGSNGITLLRRIYIPLSQNMIIWSSCILFAYGLGSFEVNYLLSSISPVPIAARLYSLFINPDINYIPQRMALNVIIFLIGSCMVGLYGILLKILLGRVSR